MSFTSATAHLPNGSDIAYMDSGPVKGSSTYTTVVMLHGSAFNSHVFDPLHTLAARHNLRLVAVQRKDYMGSSQYTDAELEDLRNGDKKFLDHLTVLLGHFICHIIQAHNIPEPNPQWSKGGIALLGWSMGCTTAMTLLSDSTLFEEEQYKILRQFIIKLMLYDPPHWALGLEPTGGRNQTIPIQLSWTPTAEDHGSLQRFAGSYFDTPDSWDGDPNQLDPRPATDRITTDSWSEKQWEKIYEPTIAPRSEYPMNADMMQSTIHDMLQRALFDENVVKVTFPDVAVLYFACWRSAKPALWAYDQMQLAYQQRIDRNQFTRPSSFKIIKDANHFWHWDFPDDFMRALADAVRSK